MKAYHSPQFLSISQATKLRGYPKSLDLSSSQNFGAENKIDKNIS